MTPEPEPDDNQVLSDYDPNIGVEERVVRMKKGDIPQQDSLNLQQEAPGEDVSDDLLQRDRDLATGWLHYAKGLGQTGFSPADRITPDTIDSLSREYVIETESAGMETNPIVVPGSQGTPPVLYYTTNNFITAAVNARTGEPYWSARYAPTRPLGFGDGTNRGVAVWHDKVYKTSGDSFLHARNRYTGEHLWKTDLMADDDELPQRSDYAGNTQAPMVHNGTVYMGESSDQLGWATLQAVDAESGDKVWDFRNCPKDMWVGESWMFSSGAAWMSPAIDPELETAFFGTTNPDPQYNGVVRPGPNKHSNSIVALDINSGEPKWITQLFAHELWDYDVHVSPTLFDMNVNGETRRVVSTDSKAGWTYILDAETGQILRRTEPHAKQGGPAFFEFPPASEDKAKLMYPGEGGTTEWPPGAYDPERNRRFLGTNEVGQWIWYDPTWKWVKNIDPGEFKGGGFTSTTGENKGSVISMNMASGEIEWQTRVPDIDPNWSMYRFNIRGTSATAGGVVFHGSSGGHLYALNSDNGDIIWSDDLEDRITAEPVTWTDEQENAQYVAMTVNDRIQVYRTN
jgi:glucose dehydrogenase